MELTVKNIEGKDTGKKVTLKSEIFGLEQPNDHLIWQDVRLIHANKRQGTAKTKTRSEVHGTGKKPYRQKGTGSARAGDRKSPLWRHGGTIFGPKPRNYSFKLNKKSRSVARASALTYKAREEAIMVLENFSFESPKTKEFLRILGNLEVNDSKVLLVIPTDNKNVYLSGRNLPKAKVIRASDLNTTDIIHADKLVIVDEAIQIIENNLLG